MSFKRNQVEEAIGRRLQPNSAVLTSELRTRMKRLLELDRSLGRLPRAKDPEKCNYAFFSTEGPGTGADILFAPYECFALYIAVQLLGHGWPQRYVVSVMRRVRPLLEPKHDRILAQSAGELFDRAAIQPNARPGDLAVDITNPLFLLLISTPEGDPISPEFYVSPEGELLEKLRSYPAGASMTAFQVSRPALLIQAELLRTAPKRRGRT